MHLNEYLKDKNIPEFAAKIGIARQTIYHWMSGRWFPTGNNWIKIKAATNGAVLPNDHLDLFELKGKTPAKEIKTKMANGKEISTEKGAW